MSEIEKIMYKAYKKGIQQRVFALSQQLIIDHPKMDHVERIETAYKIAKKEIKNN